MHSDRVIVRTYIRSDGISTIPDDQNTHISQSDDMNNAPRDPLHVPVTWNPARTQPYSTLRLRIRLRLRLQSITITASTAPLRQEPYHCCIRYPTLVRSSASASPCWQPFQTRFDALFFDMIRLTCFPTILYSLFFQFDLTHIFFDFIRLTCF